MARTLTIYVERGRVPDRAALQQAINALEFPLVLDSGYVPFKTAGYVPGTLDGEDAGFDLRFHDVPAERAQQLGLGARDVALALKWAGDPREEAAAYAVAAAFGKRFDAAILGDGDVPLAPDDLLRKARQLKNY